MAAKRRVWTVPRRLAELYKRLGTQSSRTAEEALERIVKTLDKVEDLHSGVPKKDPPPPPGSGDGRLYPPLEDRITRHSDGSITARTVGHDIEIEADGSVTIRKRHHQEKTDREDRVSAARRRYYP
jgi:hypothetical protein